VAALSGAGKVLNGPDLSFESQAAGTRYLDGYGHGTHMAAIIAGRDPSTPGFWIGRPMPGQQMATWLESTVAGRKNGLGAPLPGAERRRLTVRQAARIRPPRAVRGCR